MRHRFWYALSERIRWSRGAFHETPARVLTGLDPRQEGCLEDLRTRYGVRFEDDLCAATSLNNYEYLEILDHAGLEGRLSLRRAGTLCDVGCASFWYAAALQAYFRPERMVGVEVEGYRLFRNGHTRIDYATGYLSRFPGAQFLIGDYSRQELPADVITAWFPFVTATALLAWRLPLALLAPDSVFARIKNNLRPGGLFVMVNHGTDESEVAIERCTAAGLRLLRRLPAAGVLSAYRTRTPILSCWTP